MAPAMSRLPFTFLLALAACSDDPGPTTDTSPQTTTATTGETPGDSTSTTGSPTTGLTTTTDAATTDLTGTTTAPVDLTTSTSTTDPDPITTTATTTSDDTTSTSSTTTDTTTGGESSLVIAIVDAELYADCQPRIEPDPVDGTWYVQFDNSDGAADTLATLVSASLSLADADPPVIEKIQVTPKDSGPIPAGEQVEKKMAKLESGMHSACDHCDEFYKLDLEYEENGAIHHAIEDVTISCSF